MVVGHIETHQILQQGWGSGARGLPTGDVRVCVYKEQGSWERTRPPCALRLATF